MKQQIVLLLIIISLAATIAEAPVSINVSQGKSNFTIQQYFPPIYASQLIEQDPQIQSISLEEYGQTYGYLNTLGGIGTNFLIEPDKTYEISSSENITINLEY